MAASIETFRLRFPEFSDETEYSDARIQLVLDDAKLIYLGDDEDRWCNRYDLAQSYIAAHMLTKGSLTEAGDINTRSGAITSKTAGGVSVSRTATSAAGSLADDYFMSTAYGQQYLVIRNSCFVPVMVANKL